MMSPRTTSGWTGGLTARRASLGPSEIHGMRSDGCLGFHVARVASVTGCWSSSVVAACEPNQNSVAPLVVLKSHRGMLAIM